MRSQTSGLGMAKIPSKRALISFVIINSWNIQFQFEQSVNPDSKVTPDELVKLHKGKRRACSCAWGAAELQKFRSHNCSAKTSLERIEEQQFFFTAHRLRLAVGSDVDGYAVLWRDHVSGAGQVHEHGAEVGEGRRDGDVQPVGDWWCVGEGPEPQAVAHSVPYVVWCQRDKEQPGQRTPRVLQPARPHEQAQWEAEHRDQRGAVQRRTPVQVQSRLTHTHTEKKRQTVWVCESRVTL